MFDIEEYKREFEKIANLIADEIINKADKEILDDIKLSDEYHHFGIGLWIRNNYIYPKKDVVENFFPDDLSHAIYNIIKDKLINK